MNLDFVTRPNPAQHGMTETAPGIPAGPAPGRPLRVAVLVDLYWTPAAGGHVKYWERAAAGAAGLGRKLDLTVYFAAEAENNAEADTVQAIAENVRYRLLRPVFSTKRLRFLAHVPDHTDLAPHHRRLAQELGGFDVVHTTDGYFAFARTAEKAARRGRFALVNSVHTDTPKYTSLYTRETVRRLFGHGWIARVLLDRFHVDARAERGKLARLARHQAASAFVFGPRDQDLERARRVLPAERVVRLPRGLELERFNPKWRSRDWLAAKYGIAPEMPVVLCVGRVDVGKNVMVLAEAISLLAGRGERVVLVCAGEGEDRERIEALLGAHARCPGAVLGDDLSRLYASADLLAHPSEIESFGNTVAEGMAAGLAALVSVRGDSRRQIADGVSGLAVGPAPEDWAAAIAGLLRDPLRRAGMGRAARRATEERFTDWRQVVAEKLLPVWRAAAARPAG